MNPQARENFLYVFKGARSAPVDVELLILNQIAAGAVRLGFAQRSAIALAEVRPGLVTRLGAACRT